MNLSYLYNLVSTARVDRIHLNRCKWTNLVRWLRPAGICCKLFINIYHIHNRNFNHFYFHFSYHIVPTGVGWHPFEQNPPLWLQSLMSQYSPSSAPFGQSGILSQTEVILTHRFVTSGHCHWPDGHLNGGGTQAWAALSSELSPQSFLPSQTYAKKA